MHLEPDLNQQTTSPRYLISVIIPCYNRADLISETLDSVLCQTYRNWECIVVDDGSGDGTREVVDRYVSVDSRFRLIRRDRLPAGAPTCRNIGIEYATGYYLLFLDSDDILAVSCLETRIRVAMEYPENNFWVFRTAQFNNLPGDSMATWNVLNKKTDDLQRFILQDLPWHTMGPLWLKRSVLKIAGFDETAICWQDWEFHIRALLILDNYWKSPDDIVDSYYRNNKLNKGNAISKHHNDLSHIVARTNLFHEIFIKVTAIDQRREIYNAFAVLFFRLFLELNGYDDKKQMENLFEVVGSLSIYSRTERIIMRLLSVKIKQNEIDLYRNRLFFKILCVMNPGVFDNHTNYTFQH